MRLAMLSPVLAALLGLALGWFLPRFLSPRRAAQTLTISVLLTSTALVAALVQVTLAGLSEIPAVADAVGWCRALYHGQHGASPLIGGVAALLLLLALVGMGRQWRRLRREQAPFADVDGVEVVPSVGPVAFAVPGRPGGVVIGACVFEELGADGRSAVLAHELAHLQHRHHLYVRSAAICAAGMPFLKPLASQVRFMTERWADEVAAQRIGSRRVLAETIARVALMPGRRVHPGLAFGAHHTVSRVDALLHPTVMSPFAAVPAGSAVGAVVLLGSGWQVHHLAAFFAHICPF
jgi:Zn-dependent protease with chaperone function